MKSKMAGAAIMNFWVIAFLVTLFNSRCDFVPTYKIAANSLNPGRKYCYFFQNPRWRPSAILE